MKYKFLLLFLMIISSSSGQKLIKCNDSISYWVSYKNDYCCSIMLNGTIIENDNPRVITYNDYILQTLFVDKQKYISDKTDDISILTNYIISETQYSANIFKEKLNLMMIPVSISQNKKAVVWYFDLPKSFLENSQKNEIPALRQISISTVIDNFIYSIGTTQFIDQNFDELKEMLINLIKTIKCQKDNFELNDLCKK